MHAIVLGKTAISTECMRGACAKTSHKRMSRHTGAVDLLHSYGFCEIMTEVFVLDCFFVVEFPSPYVILFTYAFFQQGTLRRGIHCMELHKRKESR